VRARALVVWLVLAGCHQAEGSSPPVAPAKAPPAAPAKPKELTDEDYAMPALPMARVTLTDAFGGQHVVEVEVAATHDSRTRGLMWRTQLAEGKGMLFIFTEQQPLSFWMRNTLIPLDMVFIDKDARIAGIVEQAEPKTLSSRSPGRPAMYVLEVPGGWAAKVGLKAGSLVKFDGTQQIAVLP